MCEGTTERHFERERAIERERISHRINGKTRSDICAMRLDALFYTLIYVKVNEQRDNRRSFQFTCARPWMYHWPWISTTHIVPCSHIMRCVIIAIIIKQRTTILCDNTPVPSLSSSTFSQRGNSKKTIFSSIPRNLDHIKKLYYLKV